MPNSASLCIGIRWPPGLPKGRPTPEAAASSGPRAPGNQGGRRAGDSPRLRASYAEPRRPHFTDIAPKSNFTYRTDNNFTGRKYFPQTMCGGVAAFDFDNDGHMDLFFTNGAKLPEMEKTDARFYNCLLRNRGDGTFEDVTARAGLLGKELGLDRKSV